MTNEPAASGHTPEPWNAPGRVVRASDCFNFVQITVEDYKRACVCVDACTGLSDPAAEIARLREAKEESEDHARSCGEITRIAVIDHQRLMVQRDELLAALRAAAQSLQTIAEQAGAVLARCQP